MTRLGGLMLHMKTGSVVDWPPPFRFGTPKLPEMARKFEPFIVTLMPDEEAWEVLFDDEFRLETFRTIRGNRPWLRKKSFDAA